MTDVGAHPSPHQRGRRDRIALMASVVGPLAVAAALIPWRETASRTDAALVLVLVVVAVAANGYRLAGLLAALSAAVWFDFFLTRPYQRLAITDPADIRTTVLLLLVGLSVTEIAVWGRRQHAELDRREGYEAGIRDAAGSLAAEASPTATIDAISVQLTQLLHLTSCRFDFGTGILGGRQARLRLDGEVESGGAVVDVERVGLPTDQEIELLVTNGRRYQGRFLMTAGPDARPSLAQRLVAVALAERAGAVLVASSATDR